MDNMVVIIDSFMLVLFVFCLVDAIVILIMEIKKRREAKREAELREQRKAKARKEEEQEYLAFKEMVEDFIDKQTSFNNSIHAVDSATIDAFEAMIDEIARAGGYGGYGK